MRRSFIVWIKCPEDGAIGPSTETAANNSYFHTVCKSLGENIWRSPIDLKLCHESCLKKWHRHAAYLSHMLYLVQHISNQIRQRHNTFRIQIAPADEFIVSLTNRNVFALIQWRVVIDFKCIS